MGAIQVKNVPEELHQALRERAAAEHMDLQAYLLLLIRRELALPSQRDWLEELRAQPSTTGTPPAAGEVRALRRERADRR